MFRTLPVALAILLRATISRADEFSSGPDPAAGSCEQIYQSAVAGINDAKLVNETQAKKEKIDCNGDQGCVEAAKKRYLAAQRDINKRYADASGERDRCRQRRASLSGAVEKAVSDAAPLPPGAVAKGDPDAADAGAPGFVGSFPGTKSKWGSFCYTYLCESNVWTVNPSPTENPNAVGHDTPGPGDAALVYQKIKGTNYYLPVHFAVYQGNDTFYQRNGASSIEVVNSQFFNNFSNAVVRYVNKTTGK